MRYAEPHAAMRATTARMDRLRPMRFTVRGSSHRVRGRNENELAARTVGCVADIDQVVAVVGEIRLDLVAFTKPES